MFFTPQVLADKTAIIIATHLKSIYWRANIYPHSIYPCPQITFGYAINLVGHGKYKSLQNSGYAQNRAGHVM